MADETFSPETHRFAEPRYFDDFRVGERFYIPSRTMTEALFAAFQLASGDNHPIHYDRPYCRARGHQEPMRQEIAYPMLAITALEPGRTTGVVVLRVTIHNQDKELVMEGEHRYLLRRKP